MKTRTKDTIEPAKFTFTVDYQSWFFQYREKRSITVYCGNDRKLRAFFQETVAGEEETMQLFVYPDSWAILQELPELFAINMGERPTFRQLIRHLSKLGGLDETLRNRPPGIPLFEPDSDKFVLLNEKQLWETEGEGIWWPVDDDPPGEDFITWESLKSRANIIGGSLSVLARTGGGL